MHWKKMGQIYRAEYIHPKLASHAANPLPVLLEGDVYRVFFSGRDEQNRSSVGFLDLDILSREVLSVHDRRYSSMGRSTVFIRMGSVLGIVMRSASKPTCCLWVGNVMPANTGAATLDA
jgi:hypothetical protein